MNGTFSSHLMRSWRHHLPLQLATVGVLALVLLLLSMMMAFRQNLARLNTVWGDNLEFTVYLKEGAPADGVGRFVQELSGDPGFSQVRLVTKEEALQRFVGRMGDLAPDFVRAPEFDNPLPELVEIKLKNGNTASDKVAALRALAGRFAGNTLVEDVSYGRGWIENWAGFIVTIQLISAAAMVLTVGMGLLIVGNSVRVSLSQRRDEIEIMELVGATSAWIRRPFIVEGAVLGFLAFGIAFAVGHFLQLALLEHLKAGLSFWSVTQEMDELSSWGWGAVALIGMCFGAGGAYVCVRGLNSGWSAAERWEK